MDLALQVPAAAGHEVDGAVAVLVGARVALPLHHEALAVVPAVYRHPVPGHGGMVSSPYSRL